MTYHLGAHSFKKGILRRETHNINSDIILLPLTHPLDVISVLLLLWQF